LLPHSSDGLPSTSGQETITSDHAGTLLYLHTGIQLKKRADQKVCQRFENNKIEFQKLPASIHQIEGQIFEDLRRKSQNSLIAA
jgi:hypothetical protein